MLLCFLRGITEVYFPAGLSCEVKHPVAVSVSPRSRHSPHHCEDCVGRGGFLSGKCVSLTLAHVVLSLTVSLRATLSFLAERC